jgi:hypothetical protein
VVVVLTVAFAGCGGGDGRRVVLPEDPCALVRADDVAAAVHALFAFGDVALRPSVRPAAGAVAGLPAKGAALPDSSQSRSSATTDPMGRRVSA